MSVQTEDEYMLSIHYEKVLQYLDKVDAKLKETAQYHTDLMAYLPLAPCWEKELLGRHDKLRKWIDIMGIAIRGYGTV